MKALVIGGSGMLGRALVPALRQAGMDVVSTYKSRPFPGGEALDITDSEAVDRSFKLVRPDVVFIAVTPPGGADYCETHPDELNLLNVESTRTIAENSLKFGARVVYYSSDYVFDGQKGPYSEEDDPSPINVYGKTKLEAEETLQVICPDALIIRTTAVFAWERTSPNFAMQVWDALQAGNHMKVPDDQIGNPTLASYLAEASVRLVQQSETGVFNVVGKDLVPRSVLGKELARAMALDQRLIDPTPTLNLDQQAARPLNAGLKTDKLEKVLGTEPPSLSDSLKKFRRNWRSETHTPQTVTSVSEEASKLKGEILDRVSDYYRLVHGPQEFVPYESRIQYAGRVFGEEEMRNLTDSSLDFWLTLGPYGDLFESRMRRYFGSAGFTLVNSGSSANLTAILALMSHQLDRPLSAGDEVITPAVTFPTTLAPIVHGGMIPVFVDCKLGTYNIDPDQIEAAISDKTRAIFVPHTLGNPCDMEVITDIAKRHSLFLVEDSCDALGGRFNGQLVGTFGDLATLSFYPAHHITLGEGGGVVVNAPGLARVVQSVRDWGRDCWCASGESNTCGQRFGWQLGDLPLGYDHKYTYSNLGYNFKPTDMQAAIGVAQMDRLDDFVTRRNSNFGRLYEGLKAYEDRIMLPVSDDRAEPSWFGFPITVRDGVSRNELVQSLEKANIETRFVFAGNIALQPGYAGINARYHDNLINTDRVMRDTFFVGVYPGLGEVQIDFMIERFAEFFRSH
ncbi:MAG: lipopolysaccharide biosynthesis protein RfbH [Dehalococcoidia bacterium]